MSDNNQFERLLTGYLSETISGEEKKLFFQLLQEPEYEAVLTALMNKDWKEDSFVAPLTDESLIQNRIREQVWQHSKKDKPQPALYRKMNTWKWVAAAMVAGLMIGAGYMFIYNKQAKEQPVQIVQHDLPPGHDGAILTLEDGRQIVLDTVKNGLIAAEAGADVLLEDGKIAYNATHKTDAPVGYNKMATPRGRQFKLVLPDGSKVWLNAASSIRYPTVFTGNTREVEVVGEAFFEVVENKKMPFRVQVNGQAVIEVLGTSFNVNAYENETSINTTLVTGRIKMTAGDSVILKPGQAAKIMIAAGANKANMQVQQANLEKVLAWKSGAFNFEESSLAEAMRQLERWYDIEIVINKDVSDEPRFYGEISKSMSLQHLLNLLKTTDLKFNMEGERKLIITQ